MNKILSETIAGLIPRRHAKNRWRGLLRYGVRNLLRLKKELKKNRSTPEYYLSVLAMAKNEGPYFKEWLDWHIDQGVDKFFIYDNESTDNTREILQPYIDRGIVEYNYWTGKKQELPIHDDCFNRHRFDTRWLAVIDLDEFIVPVKHKNIREFLAEKESFASVEINWLVYGSGGAREKEEGDVMKRFTRHSLPRHPLNRHVKSISNPRMVCSMIGPHEAARIKGNAADSHGDIIRQVWSHREPQHDVIKINHYAVKSYEEFLQKRARGRSHATTLRDMSYFDQYDLNDIEEGARE